MVTGKERPEVELRRPPLGWFRHQRVDHAPVTFPSVLDRHLRFSVIPAETGTNYLARRKYRPDCARLCSEWEVYQEDNWWVRGGTKDCAHTGRMVGAAQR